MKTLLVVSLWVALVVGQKDPHFLPGHNTIVHLFEWTWDAVANECEGFLKDKGYGGVQISPPNENLVIDPRPWWERYQPVSYVLSTRSGDEAAFASMTRRCNDAGIRIYVDTIINHMSGGSGTGTAGNSADYGGESFPGVPYSQFDFHAPCSIDNYQDPTNVRECQLVGLLDLNQSTDYVRDRIIEYLNHLIDLGVGGFRIDAAKHMWPADLDYIFSSLKDLNVDYGFAAGSRAFIFQEVIDYGGEAISKYEYTGFGTVVEFQYSKSLGRVFHGNDKLTYLVNWGPEWGLADGFDAVAFIDNHDNQRSGDPDILTYREPKQYKMAIAFMLAHPYGTNRLMSSFAFDYSDQGPPADGAGNLIPPSFNPDDTCTNGYVCEHRWRQIYNMVGFRNVVMGTAISNWWSNGDQQIAFCRGDRGFILFTNYGDVDGDFQTCLPEGVYCDIISGSLINGECTGKLVTVEVFGWAHIALGSAEEDGVLAIHIDSKQR